MPGRSGRQMSVTWTVSGALPRESTSHALSQARVESLELSAVQAMDGWRAGAAYGPSERPVAGAPPRRLLTAHATDRWQQPGKQGAPGGHVPKTGDGQSRETGDGPVARDRRRAGRAP